MPGTWFPGQVAVGGRVFNNNVIINGQAILQKGITSYPPTVVTPGTLATGGTYTNTTGYDCMIYMQATTIGTLTLNGITLGGSAAVNANLVSVYLPANQSIIVPYSGALTWHWLAV